ncbi:Actin/actin-like protein [Martensiomyces pterosporus]|nr:Actin/actin-like protein [Martensiomyces pterosporus]
MKTLILDNGSHTIKGGYAEDSGSEAGPRVIPNTVTRTKRTKRVYVADLIDKSTDLSGLYFRSPFERGYLVHWDAEIAVWDRIFSNDVFGCTPTETHLIATEPVFNFKQVQKSFDEVIFEEYRFSSLIRAPAPRLATIGAASVIYGDDVEPECVLIVDIGHAFTYVVPYLNGRQISKGVRRLDIGGRLLTNYMKETVSFRYWDMMDETYIMNAVKEKCCFVSQDFYKDLEAARGLIAGRGARSSPLGIEYVLPDFTHSKQGFVKGHGGDAEDLMADKQILPLCNERFAIPEALFHPSDIGLEQGGLHEAIMQSVSACPENTRGVLLSNILLVGGTASLPGLQQRLQAEVQAAASCRVHISTPSDPATWAFHGGQKLAQLLQDNDGSTASEQPREWRVSREQYEEVGPDRVIAHFNRFI